MTNTVETVKQIITDNIYLTLATSHTKPWAAPLFYCTDFNFNFYFISQMDSLHAQHISKDPNVAFAIFDSTVEEGKGIGIQGSGIVELLESVESIKEGLKYYHTTFVPCNVGYFSGVNPYRLYKLIPTAFYTQDPNASVDKRVEVPINELIS